MKNILIVINLSQNSGTLIKYAIALAKNKKIKITFIYDSQLSANISLLGILMKNNNHTISVDGLRELCFKFNLSHKNLECDFIDLGNQFSNEVFNILEKKKIDLVLMEIQKNNGLNSSSYADKIIGSSKCLVLIIPEGIAFHKFHKITFATNYYASDIDALKKIVILAKSLKSKVEVIHVCDGEFNNYSEEFALKHFEKIVHSRIWYEKISMHLVKGEDEEKELARFGNVENTDLLAISVRKRGLVEKLFFKDMATKLAHDINVPFLIMHHNGHPEILV
jgi:nucleotide-binding universal stress UspA family protein